MLRQIFLLAALVIAVVIIGALVTWPAWLLFHNAGSPHFDRMQTFSTLAAGVVLSTVYLYRGGGKFLRGLGVTGRPNRLLPAFLAGILVLVILELFYLGLGVRHVNTAADVSAGHLALLAGKSLLAGLMVAVFEEVLFRGALQGGIQLRLNATAAVILSSLIYAAAHYLKFPEPSGAVTWSTGITLLPQALRWFKLPGIVPSFLALFSLGVLLALSRRRRGNIYECMGFHAGLVAALKVRTYLTDYTPGTHYDFLVGRYSSDLGWPAIVMLAGLIVLYLRPAREADTRGG